MSLDIGRRKICKHLFYTNDTSGTHAKDVDTTLIVRALALLPLVLAISANARIVKIKNIILSREIIR